MRVDSATAMRVRGPWRGLITGVVAIAAVMAISTSPPAAPYPASYNSAQAILAQGRPDSPPPGANDWSCQPSAAHPRPVLLVHGLLANQTVNWQTASPVLAN